MLLLVSACKEAPCFDQAQQESSQQRSGQAVAKEQHKVVTSTNSFRQPVMALSESIPKRKKALREVEKRE